MTSRQLSFIKNVKGEELYDLPINIKEINFKKEKKFRKVPEIFKKEFSFIIFNIKNNRFYLDYEGNFTVEPEMANNFKGSSKEKLKEISLFSNKKYIFKNLSFGISISEKTKKYLIENNFIYLDKIKEISKDEDWTQVCYYHHRDCLNLELFNDYIKKNAYILYITKELDKNDPLKVNVTYRTEKLFE